VAFIIHKITDRGALMNKREMLFNLIDGGPLPPYVPAAFFLHFPPEFHRGQKAVEKHLEYYRYTGMDMVKIQYENVYPHLPEIQRPGDWAKMPKYGLDFYEDQLSIVSGLVKAGKKEAVVVQTLYSPFMCASDTVGNDLIIEHLNEDPDSVKRGLEIITESKLLFVRECIKRGVDGFYHSTEGGETGRLKGGIFEAYVKPTDLIIMQEINDHSPFNILHVCDYLAPYDDFSPYLDYPGDIVNVPLEEGGRPLTMEEAAQRFGRPYMGGLERKGILATGTPDQVRREVENLLPEAPERFILGADCTVPGDTPWENLKAAINAAHAFRRDTG
jgi:uroporphyrinogen decarboxylase